MRTNLARLSSGSTFPLIFIPLVIFSTIASSTRLLEAGENGIFRDAMSLLRPKCDVLENEPLHAVMDRVCEVCHDLYSHQNPNMRSQCRSECFQSDYFKKCLRLFKPSRRIRVESG